MEVATINAATRTLECPVIVMVLETDHDKSEIGGVDLHLWSRSDKLLGYPR